MKHNCIIVLLFRRSLILWGWSWSDVSYTTVVYIVLATYCDRFMEMRDN